MSTEGTERRRVDTGVSESEERLQEIFSHAAVGIAQIGLDGEWLLVNNRYCEMLGYSEAELRTKTLQDLTYPDDWDATLTVHHRLLAGEISSHTIEKRYIRKDGTIYWGRLHRSLVRDRENRPKYFVAVVEDVTKKIEAERALRDSEQRLRLAQRAVNFEIWDRNLRTSEITISAECARLYGFPDDHPPLTYAEWISVIHPDDRERIQTRTQGTFEQRDIDTEFRFLWPDGSEHWMHQKGSVLFDESGRPMRRVGVNLDITERKRAEAALRESEKRLRFAQQAASVGTFDWNIETGVNTWTPELEAIYGLPPGGFPGTQAAWEDLVHPDDRALAVLRVKESFETGTPVEAEWRIILIDGRVRWLLGRWQVFKNAAGKPLRMMGVNIDVTDRKQLEEVLRQSEERFRLAIKATNDAIWDVDLENGSVTWNETYGKLYGRPPETSDSWQWWIDRIHPEDCERTVGGLRMAISSGASSWTCEYHFRRADGAWAYIYDRAYIARDASGKAWRVIGAMQDLTERKEAEAALRESEERFRVTFFQAAVGIAQTSPDGQWLLINDRFCEMLGYSQTELRGKTFLDITHPDDREASLTAVRQLLAGEISSWLKEKRYIRKDGGTVWGRLFSSLVRDQDNQPRYFISVVEDITEQRLVEERLRASEAQLMDAQHLAKIGSWERRIDTGWSHWSDEMCRILGVRDDAPTGMPAFVNCVHPKDREKVLEAERNALAARTPVETEYRIIRPDGEVRFLRSIVEAIRDDQGVPVRITGATQDITEQVKARELLRESEGRLQNAARLAHVGYWQWDLQTNRVSGTEEMFRIFGKPRDYTPSYDDFLRSVIPQDKERVARWVSDCLAEKKGSDIEYQIFWPNGDLRTVSCISEVSLDEEGVPTRMFGACQDITDFRRAQQENLARQKLESVGTLASGIAHDFNNLLGAVVAQAELALGELATGSHPEEELKAIRDVAMRGSEIVRQLMIYAGKDSAAVELVNVSGIVEEMLQLLKVSVSKHAVLETDLGKDLPAVRADAAQLRQIVLNLVTNASEAIGDRDGVIRVTTKRVEGRPSTITKGLAEGDYLQLEVSDSGCGMSQETQARVFDPFFTTKSSGHGLGLAVVHGIVRGLGGAIHVASEPAKGTTFQVFLPCAETTVDANSDPISGIGESARPSQACTVLIVEDEDPLRQAVVKMLRKTGFEVLEAANGSAAIELLRANASKIDVILLDMTIPGASSHEVIAEAAQARADATVILTSAYSQEMLTPPLSAQQIWGFIRKPFELDDLVQKLRSARLATAQLPAKPA